MRREQGGNDREIAIRPQGDFCLIRVSEHAFAWTKETGVDWEFLPSARVSWSSYFVARHSIGLWRERELVAPKWSVFVKETVIDDVFDAQPV